MNQASPVHSATAGFSLVETLVALVIGLLATFVIMQMFAVSEGRKRASTGGADAQTNAAVALYMMERDVRQAGYGLAPNTEDFVPIYTPPPAGVLTNGILAQCANVRAYNRNRPSKTDFVYADSTFAPVVINPPNYPAGDTNTDVVLVNYSGSSGMLGNGVSITQSGGTTQGGGNVPDYLAVASRAGFMQGDMILAVPPAGTVEACTIGEVTGLPVAKSADSLCPDGAAIDASATNAINHNAVSYKSIYTGCVQVDAAWNASGAGLPYAAGSRLYNLGPVGAFVSRAYAVRKGNLTMCNLTTNDCTAAVADPPDASVWAPISAGVVGLRAQYGKDTDFAGTINAWDVTQLTGADRAQAVALRIAIVARSSQYEQEIVTSAAPVWRKDSSLATQSDIVISASSTDWQHYRYKVAQSIVPLRNMIWGQQR